MKVFLIGMMGSGKSYWAYLLAKQYKITAYDLDHLIEIFEEKTVAEIFAEDGEEYFRKTEAKILRWFGEKKNFVLATGGGAPCFHNNMEWMNKHGATIWLNEPVETLVKKLEPEKAHRPLIKDLSNENLAAFLQKKLEERSPIYNLAHYHLQEKEIKLKDFDMLKSENKL
jgi:shikimate kinase